MTFTLAAACLMELLALKNASKVWSKKKWPIFFKILQNILKFGARSPKGPASEN